MKYIRQFSIILAIAVLGEILHNLLPWPVPASIYGVIVLFLLLEFRVIKLSSVKKTGDFLLEIMPIMFVPPTVGLLEVTDILAAKWMHYVLIAVISTFAVMFVSGHTVQIIAKIKEGKQN